MPMPACSRISSVFVLIVVTVISLPSAVITAVLLNAATEKAEVMKIRLIKISASALLT